MNMPRMNDKYYFTLSDDEVRTEIIKYMVQNDCDMQCVATQLQIHRNTIYNFMKGKSDLSIDTYKRLENLLNRNIFNQLPYEAKVYKGKEVKKVKETPKKEIKSRVLQDWMIRNIQFYGNTVVSNSQIKKYGKKAIIKEFQRFGFDVEITEKGIVELKEEIMKEE